MSGPVRVNPTIFSKDKAAAKADPKKEESDRLQKILLELLKEEENKYCADCQAKSPRWAAWNLGVFICIRCAGLHRNLGVHISKVRSVNLDSWSAEQIQQMENMGNERARSLYEASLPDGFRRPATSDQQMEQFIRAKYEQKRYYPLDSKMPPLRENRRIAVSSNGHSIVKKSSESAKQEANLLDFSTNDTSASDAPIKSSLISDGFEQMKVSKTQGIDDPFGDFVSATTTTETVGGFANFDRANHVEESPQLFGATAAPEVPTNTALTTHTGFSGLKGVFSSTPVTQNSGCFSSSLATDNQRSNADIMALFGAAPTPNFTAPPLGGFSPTAYGLSQFGKIADALPQFDYKDPTQTQFRPHQLTTNEEFITSMPGNSLPNFTQPSRIFPNTANQMSATRTNPPQPQTRAMKAFDGIDKDMFMMASGLKKTPNTKKDNQSQDYATLEVFSGTGSNNTTITNPPPSSSAAGDLLDLF